MSNDVAIRIQGLTKVYKLYESPMSRFKEALHPFKKKYHRDFHALQNLSLEIKKGECVGIIGKNGSGKSTLLKVITGVLTPTSGSVTVQGKVSAILELGAGFNPEMTGVENIYLNNALNGMNKVQTDKKIKEIIEFADLGDFIHQPIKTYSSGMKARLAFAVSINVEPDILIVDEALSVGDASFGRKCFAKMEEIRAKGATILFVSHSEASIVNLCSRAIWINRGEQVIEGPPKLITGLYAKHVNEAVLNKQQVLLECQKLSSSVNTITPNVNSEELASAVANPPSSNPLNSKKNDRIEYYDPLFTSRSAVFYEEKGARISDVKITTFDGVEVNTLSHGGHYIYTYKVSFFKKFDGLRVGFLIKNVQGIALSGGSKKIENVGQSITVKWTFKACFGAGAYFVNAGTSSNGEHIHRILDAYSFKVLRSDEEIFTGLVNCVLGCEVQSD